MIAARRWPWHLHGRPGRPPGPQGSRTRESTTASPGGGIGRRRGLKIPRPDTAVRVRVPPWALLPRSPFAAFTFHKSRPTRGDGRGSCQRSFGIRLLSAAALRDQAAAIRGPTLHAREQLLPKFHKNLRFPSQPGIIQAIRDHPTGDKPAQPGRSRVGPDRITFWH